MTYDWLTQCEYVNDDDDDVRYGVNDGEDDVRDGVNDDDDDARGG